MSTQGTHSIKVKEQPGRRAMSTHPNKLAALPVTLQKAKGHASGIPNCGGLHNRSSWTPSQNRHAAMHPHLARTTTI
jgi:hypothetical protein